MKADIFKRFDNASKQKDIARYFIARLKSQSQAEHPCVDYASARALAHMVSCCDSERLCQTIHIYGTFVRIVRNEKGAFAFAPVVLDHYDCRLSIQGSSPPPVK